MIRIVAPCRIHLGLIDLFERSKRVFGGVGVSIWHYRTVVTASCNVIGGTKITGLDKSRSNTILDALSRAKIEGVSLNFQETPPAHCGFGSGTSLRLASLEAAHLAMGKSPSRNDLVALSQRGGASGIGVISYFEGGVVADLGRRRTKNSKLLQSSALEAAYTSPRLLFNIAWPSTWSILIAYPKTSVGLSGDEEQQFMRMNTPVDYDECAKVAHALCFELPAALLDHDFLGFRDALKRSRLVGLKAREIERQPDVARVLKRLDGISGIAATMSSLGPAVFIVINKSNLSKSIFEFLPREWTILEGPSARMGRYVEQ